MSDRTPDHRSPDDELRRLLDDAVSEVEPTPALSSIRDRTKVTPMTRHRSWLVAAAAAVAVSAATVTTVALTGDDAEPDRAQPAATPDVSPTDDGAGDMNRATSSAEISANSDGASSERSSRMVSAAPVSSGNPHVQSSPVRPVRTMR